MVQSIYRLLTLTSLLIETVRATIFREQHRVTSPNEEDRGGSNNDHQPGPKLAQCPPAVHPPVAPITTN